MRLYCDVDASPEAEIAWLKSTPGEVSEALNKNMTDSELALIISSLQEEQVLTQGPELAINGVKRGDAGKCALLEKLKSIYSTPGLYYCVAKNTRGLVNKSLELEVYCKFSLFF